MTDKRSLNDQDIENLLGQLKSAKSEYPADLKARRRQLFINSIATGPLPAALKHVSLFHGAGGPMSVVLKVAIGALATSAVIATATLGASLYKNRATLTEHLFGKTTNAVYASQIPVLATPIVATLISTANPVSTPTATLPFTIEPKATPIEVTPPPPNDGSKGNNGLHLGQTPHATKKPPPGKKTPGH